MQNAATILALTMACGCLHLHQCPPLDPWPQVRPPAHEVPAGAWLSSVLGLGLGLVFMHWLGRRRAERDGLVLDREELALVRTARDALRLLMRRRRWPGPPPGVG